jgi:hypothetical protein
MKISLTTLFVLTAFAGFSQPSCEQIQTLDGKTYKAASVQRVEPDGVFISYAPAGGGVGMTKLKFADLPEALRQRFHYDPEKAGAYKAEEAQSKAAYAKQLWADYRETTNRIAKRLAKEEAEALEQKKQAQLAKKQAEAERRANEYIENLRRETKILEQEERRLWGPLGAPNHLD